MLAVRYRDEGEDNFYEFPDDQVEQIVPKDIFELLGDRGVVLEMLKNINIFQSEPEFVESMAVGLGDYEGEIYLQDEFDEFDNNENNDCYVVMRAKDISKLLGTTYAETYKAIYKVVRFLKSYMSYLSDILETVSPAYILYFICTAIAMCDEFKDDNIAEIMSVFDFLISTYYDTPKRIADVEPDVWKVQINEFLKNA